MKLIVKNRSEDSYSFAGNIDVLPNSELEVSSENWVSLFKDVDFIKNIDNHNLILNDGWHDFSGLAEVLDFKKNYLPIEIDSKENLSWTDFKLFFVPRTLSVQWEIKNKTYWLSAFDGNIISKTCQIPITDPASEEQVDFETNHKPSGNKSFTDIDGTMLIRPKAAKKGWTYQLLPIEFTTSKLNSIYSKDINDTARQGVVYKIYNSENAEITDLENEASAVKTIVDYEPSFDYEVIGGHIQQHTKPNTNVRVWVIAVPDLPAAYGGSKEMVGGVNLKYIDPTDKVTADGRATKLLSYSAIYHTNKLRFVFRHDTGIQHDILIILETYKA